jgi:3-methyladenine DNA glycosylase AlkD
MEISLENIRSTLQELSSIEGQVAAQKFHKEKIKTYGIKMPVIKYLAKEWFKEVKPKGKAPIFSLGKDLIKSGNIEEAMIAIEWSYMLKNQFEEADFYLFESWISNYINAWSTCDNFCNNTVGAFLMKHPSYISHLKRWATAESRWLQRASSVSLIVPARNGLFLEDIFEIAELQLSSNDDLVQKGYGWALKVSSKKNLQPVYEYVKNRKSVMPRTALRYAIENFPIELKNDIMNR